MTENQYFSKIAIDLIKDYTERGYENAVACIDWLKKISQEDSTCPENQGDKNPCETCEEPRLNCQNFPCKKKKNFDSINKVKPKFHEGDWILYNNDICKIVKHEEGCNILVTQFGIEKEPVNERNLSTAKLWDISDAKDGDVLCTYECDEPKIVFILKGTPKKHYALSYHCYYNIMYPHFGSDSEKGCLAPNDEDVKPATKEQRDTLMKAMADAGYTFNFEKKELKKIDDEEYDGEDYGIDSLFHAQRILEKTLGKVDGYQTDDGILEHKCAITAVKKLYEQKPTEWSSEDEKMLNHIISIIEVADDYLIRPENIPIYRNWLKSLKDRVQSKHEWSEDDERTYKSIMYSFDHNYPLTIQQQEFVKSFRPQKQWKPSDEQITALSKALDIVKMFTPREAPRVTNLQSLYDDLKKMI